MDAYYYASHTVTYPPGWLQVQPSNGLRYVPVTQTPAVDLSDEDFFKLYTHAITVGLRRYHVRPMPGSRPVALMTSAATSAAMQSKRGVDFAASESMSTDTMVSGDMSGRNAAAGAAPQASAGGSLRLESEFEVTPLFQVLRTQADGRGMLNFTAPQKLGKFVVRAYAATGAVRHWQI